MPNNQTQFNIKTSLSPELLFLIACCQTDPSDDDIAFIQNSSSILHPPSSIVGLAARHGILPLVYKTIKNLPPVISDPIGDPETQSDSPDASLNAQRLTLNAEILTELKAHYMNISQRNMLMTAELIRIMKLLEENGIEALAFKGPVLAQMAYGDITLRQYVDLDILTHKKNVYKIVSLLKKNGYEHLRTFTEIQEKIWIKYAHEMGLIHTQKKVHLEMHWSFLDEDYPMQVDLENFWKETQIVMLNGQAIHTFSTENLLYYLCIHGSKHLWERIEWIKDLDLLITKNEIDWESVIQKAEGTGFEKMVYLGLSLCASLFHTPLPHIIKEKISAHPEIGTLSSFIFESWDTQQSTFAKTAAILKLFPGLKAQAIYLHKIILKPSFNEYRAVDLPKGMYWGYYLVRPYLLMKKYFTKKST